MKIEDLRSELKLCSPAYAEPLVPHAEAGAVVSAPDHTQIEAVGPKWSNEIERPVESITHRVDNVIASRLIQAALIDSRSNHIICGGR